MNKLLDFLKRHLFAVGIVCLLAVSGAVAAPNVARLFTSIIIRPDVGGDASATNGVLRTYHANRTNYFQISTNGDFVFYTASGTYTGFSGTVVMTNANGGGFRTNTYHGGFLVRTNS
jgi:hypothetical protein